MNKKVLCCILFAILFLFAFTPVHASEYAFPSVKSSYTWYEGRQYYVNYDASNPAATWKVTMRKQGLNIVVHDAKVTKLKSTNLKVCTVKVEGWDDYHYIDLRVEAVGKSTVSFTLTQGGVSKKYKFTVEVRPWVNPFKTIKVGSKNYTKNFDDTSHYDTRANIKGKVTLKLKKGFEFKYIEHQSLKNEVLHKYTKMNPKVNAKLKNMEHITIVLLNKKYNEDIYFYLAAIKPVSVQVEE